MVLNTFRVLCNRHHHLPPGLAKLKLHTHPLPPSSPASSCEWDHPIFVLLCLSYFILPKVLKVHLCHSTCKNFLPFESWIMKHTHIHALFCTSVHPSLDTWVAPILAAVNHAVLNMCTQLCGHLYRNDDFGLSNKVESGLHHELGPTSLVFHGAGGGLGGGRLEGGGVGVLAEVPLWRWGTEGQQVGLTSS